MSQPPDPVDLFGSLDIYVFDQILRGRIAPGMRVLDVGCGGGRNLHYFMKAGYDVAGCDQDPAAVRAVARQAAALAPRTTPAELRERFRAEAVQDCSFAAASFDVVLCIAVLHFAQDAAQLRAMLAGAWRPLRAGGVFFARLASRIGFEDRVRALESGRFALPDGTERFLVDEALLFELAEELGGELLDPIKTTNVQNLRCMTTWVLRRTS